MGLTSVTSEPIEDDRLQDVAQQGVSAERLTVTVEEAAALLGVSRATAYVLVRQGDLPSLRLGRRIVVPLRRLLALVDGEPGRATALTVRLPSDRSR